MSTSPSFDSAQDEPGPLPSTPLRTGPVDGEGELRKRPGIVSRALMALIRAYQKTISPNLGNVCRYQPTCSAYAYEAIERYGPLKGVWLGSKRLLRCTPFRRGGWDPVP